TSNGCTRSCTFTLVVDNSFFQPTCNNVSLNCTTTSQQVCYSQAGVTFVVKDPNNATVTLDGSGCFTLNNSTSPTGTYTVTATKTSTGCTRSCTFTLSVDVSAYQPVCNNVSLNCITTSQQVCYSQTGVT